MTVGTTYAALNLGKREYIAPDLKWESWHTHGGAALLSWLMFPTSVGDIEPFGHWRDDHVVIVSEHDPRYEAAVAEGSGWTDVTTETAIDLNMNGELDTKIWLLRWNTIDGLTR